MFLHLYLDLVLKIKIFTIIPLLSIYTSEINARQPNITTGLNRLDSIDSMDFTRYYWPVTFQWTQMYQIQPPPLAWISPRLWQTR